MSTDNHEEGVPHPLSSRVPSFQYKNNNLNNLNNSTNEVETFLPTVNNNNDSLIPPMINYNELNDSLIRPDGYGPFLSSRIQGKKEKCWSRYFELRLLEKTKEWVENNKTFPNKEDSLEVIAEASKGWSTHEEETLGGGTRRRMMKTPRQYIKYIRNIFRRGDTSVKKKGDFWVRRKELMNQIREIMDNKPYFAADSANLSKDTTNKKKKKKTYNKIDNDNENNNKKRKIDKLNDNDDDDDDDDVNKNDNETSDDDDNHINKKAKIQESSDQRLNQHLRNAIEEIKQNPTVSGMTMVSLRELAAYTAAFETGVSNSI